MAIGDHVVDLLSLHQVGAFNGCGFDSSVFGETTLNSFMAMDRSAWRAARKRVHDLLVIGKYLAFWRTAGIVFQWLMFLFILKGGDNMLESDANLRSRCIIPMSNVQMHLPATVGDYTGLILIVFSSLCANMIWVCADFYSSREHATNVGIMFRGVDNALQPNW